MKVKCQVAVGAMLIFAPLQAFAGVVSVGKCAQDGDIVVGIAAKSGSDHYGLDLELMAGKHPEDFIEGVRITARPSGTVLVVHWNGPVEGPTNGAKELAAIATTSVDEPSPGLFRTRFPFDSSGDDGIFVELRVDGRWIGLSEATVDLKEFDLAFGFRPSDLAEESVAGEGDGASNLAKRIRVCCSCAGPPACTECLHCPTPPAPVCSCPGCGLTC